MRRIRYSISFLLLLCCFLATGEAYQIYLNNYNCYYATSFYNQKGVACYEMVKDIKMSAKNNDVLVFISSKDILSSHETTIYIYCDQKAKSYLTDKRYLKEGLSKSLFSGTTEIIFKDFSLLPGNIDEYRCYIIGDEKNASNFKTPLIDKYGGSIPKMETSDSFRESKIIVTIIWSAYFFITTFLSIYETGLNKKEMLVKLAFGNNKYSMLFKNILEELVAILTLCIASFFFINAFTTPHFFIKYSIISISLSALTCSIMNLYLIKIDFKKYLSKSTNPKTLLSLNYFIQTIASILMIIAICSCVQTSQEYIQFHKQKNFFTHYKDYYYVSLKSTKVDISPFDELFYRTFCKESKILMIDNNISLKNSSAIFANYYALDYIRDSIPELKSYSFKKNCSYIIKDKKSIIENSDKTMIESLLSSFNPNSNVKIIEYQNNCKIICTDNSAQRSRWVKNPIIIITTVDDYTPISEEEIDRLLFNGIFSMPIRLNHLMCNINEEQLNQFVSPFNISYSIENVLAYYNNQHVVYSRSLILSAVFTVIIIFIYSTILITTIRIEYSIHSTELCIRKLIGESIIKRHSIIFTINIITVLVGTTLASIIIYHCFDFLITNVLLSGILVLLLECFFSSITIKSFENKNTVAILKGGHLL